MKNLRHFRIHREDGASLVETALSALIMVVVVFSLFELFLIFYTYHYVSYAAREGTRWAMVRGSDCANSASSPSTMKCGAAGSDVQTYIQDLGFPGINASSLTATTTWLSAKTVSTGVSATPVQTSWITCTTAPCNAPPNAVQVQVTYAFPLNVVVYKTTVNLTSTSQMVISQ